MSNPQKRIFVFDSPRTCSHLTFKLFEQHPELEQIRHPWLPIPFANDRIQLKLKCNPAAQEVHASFQNLRQPSVPEDWTPQQGVDLMLERIDEVEKNARIGKIPLLKEHVSLMIDHDFVLDVLRNPKSPCAKPGPPGCSFNPTYIPDDLLKTITPVFLIRNPLLFVHSNWKIHMPFKEAPEDEAFYHFASHRWVRIMFDYFQRQGVKDIVVVDAEDVVHNTDAFARAFCRQLGIESSWQDVWDSTMTDEERNGTDPMNMALHSIRASGGIKRDGKPDSELDLETEKQVWESKYGSTIAKGLAKIAVADMPEYLYLRQYKLKIDS